ncbi:hypothetical protein D6D02_03132 [Aureobasidium pullulans]|nr:hypothetical protein D6D02_03132 [Aureobasidium pullulans]
MRNELCILKYPHSNIRPVCYTRHDSLPPCRNMNMDTSDRQRQDWTSPQSSPIEHSTNKQFRAALPPIKMLDIDKIKREEAEYQARGTNMNMAPSAVNSPTIPYPSGPPPPYSRPSYPDARTPPEARRPSQEDPSKQANKQSLPSIHEALGVEQSASYPPAAHRPYSSAPQPAYHAPVTAPAPPSPVSARRSFAAMEPPPPPQSAGFVHAPRSPYTQPHQDVSPRHMSEHQERQRSAYAPQPAPSLQPGQSPLAHQSQYPRSYSVAGPSPSHERTASHPLSMPPAAPPPAPHHPLPYGYAPAPAPAPYPSHYAYPPSAPHSAATTSSIYQPSITQPAPPQNSEPGRAPFGDSVKRHLDMWDFGEALNEIAESSSYMLDFSRQCGARLHQSQRSDPAPGTLPQLQEIDHLMEKSRRQLDCYAKMREFIIAQQTAYFQQAQEQQFRAQDGIKRDSVHQTEESKAGGFAGAEAKKRRGRAAPPGRCHSCNRAETPEWRRGPDGARTLCNACGLHYAKLTRKAGKNAAAISSSNLRPKAPEDTPN